jgi:hypothetical protein
VRFNLLMVAGIALAAPAQAQMPEQRLNSDVTHVSGVVASICTVETENPTAAVDIRAQAAQDVTDVVYTCNSPEGFTRRISSQNGGALVRGTQGVAYLISQTGGESLAFAPVSLSGPVVTEVAASAALTSGTSGMLRVSVPSIPSGLLAGEYVDTVTIEIVPN